MKLVKSSVELIEQGSGLEGVYRQIEQAGKTCYKSEDTITEDSAKAFVDRMIKSRHGAVLEHGTVYLMFDVNYNTKFKFINDDIENNDKLAICGFYKNNKYSAVNTKIINPDKYIVRYFITTNYRVVFNHSLEDLKYICGPTKHHEKRYTMKFTIDRSISHEFVRHRTFSLAQESTRYCNYSKDKFGNELTFIIPCWLNWEEQTIHKGDFEKLGSGSIDSGIFINALLDAETNYKWLITHENWKAQEARAILPNALKTELVMTGFKSDWKHFFDLRLFGTTGKPHPDAQYAAALAYNKFVNKGILPSEEQTQLFCDNIINKK